MNILPQELEEKRGVSAWDREGHFGDNSLQAVAVGSELLPSSKGLAEMRFPVSCLALPSRIEALAVRAESLPDGWGKGGREGKGVQMCDVCVPQGHVLGPPSSVTLLSPPFSLQLRQMLGLSFHLLLQSSCSYISPGNSAGWVWEQSCTSQTHGVSLGGERVVIPFRGRIRV